MNLAEVAVFSLSATVMGAILVATWRFFPRKEPPPEVVRTEPPDCEHEIRRVKGELQELELRFTRLVEHVDERVETANKAWRRVRARERRQEELLEEEEGEELPGEYAGRGNGQGVLPLHEGMGPESDPLQEARRLVARMYGGGD